jgi:hypothetical protein
MTFLARPGSCLATLVLQEIQDSMDIGTYCQYIVEKQLWSCTKWREPKRLALPPFLRVAAPPFGPLRFGRNKVSHGLAVIFFARLEGPFLKRILHLAGVQDKNFLFSHNPLRDLTRPNSNILVYCNVSARQAMREMHVMM